MLPLTPRLPLMPLQMLLQLPHLPANSLAPLSPGVVIAALVSSNLLTVERTSSATTPPLRTARLCLRAAQSTTSPASMTAAARLALPTSLAAAPSKDHKANHLHPILEERKVPAKRPGRSNAGTMTVASVSLAQTLVAMTFSAMPTTLRMATHCRKDPK